MNKEKSYLYETHLHTYPVSRCAKAGVRETLEFYKSQGYAGVFITNHFLDGNINIDKSLPYEERLRFYFSDYEAALEIGRELGIDVFLGVEMSDWGTDFLVYGLPKEWYFAHPEIEGMDRVKQLSLLTESGALIIHAHPYRSYDCIKLFPRFVHGVEVYNGGRNDFENAMAEKYAADFGLIRFTGTDNHRAGIQRLFGGVALTSPISSESDFADRIKHGNFEIFKINLNEDV
ncbi:MAG: histidinol-phosphatase [Clostridia bacterium]|nr:histidinol-phosphatase [Clostridia bacterium]